MLITDKKKKNKQKSIPGADKLTTFGEIRSKEDRVRGFSPALQSSRPTILYDIVNAERNDMNK